MRRRSCLVSTVQNHNELSVWDWESQSRSLVLWASPVPPLSSFATTSASSTHNIYRCPFAIEISCFDSSRQGSHFKD